MKTRGKIIVTVFSILMVTLMLGLVPASSQQESTNADHPIDQAILLMFSSHMRLNGEVESAQITDGHMAALSQQASSGNEVDALIQLYADMIAKLRASDDYNPELEARLTAELENKVADLKEKARLLERRRRRGLGRFLGRAFKGAGRFMGRVVGGALEGAGKVVEFAIEDVAPKVLKDALYGGSPLNAALVRKVTRKLLINRVTDAIVRNQRRQMEGESWGQPTVDPAALPTLHPDVQATRDADPEDASELDEVDLDQDEIIATREALNATAEAASGGNSSPGEDIVYYDFTASDAYNFNSDWGVGSFQWQTYWQSIQGERYCFMESIFVDTASVHLEFNQEEKTVSGYIEAFAQESSDGGGMPYNISGSYRVEFSDLPAHQNTSDPANGIAISFKGNGSGSGSISGTATCRHYSEGSKSDVYNSISGSSTNTLSVPITISLFLPGHTTSAGNLHSLSITGGTMAEEGFKYTFSFSFSQPFEVSFP